MNMFYFYKNLHFTSRIIVKQKIRNLNMLEFFVGPPPPMGKLVFDLDKGKLNLVCDSRHISFYKNLRRHSPLMQA